MSLKDRVIWLGSVLTVVLALAGVSAVFAALAGGVHQTAASRSQPATPPASATPLAGPSETAVAPAAAPAVSPSATPSASPLRTCSIAALAADPQLAVFEGTVINTATGEVLFDRSGTTPASPGSVIKLLTSAAALTALGPDYRIQTRVLATPGTLVLVGGGDPTLSALPVGQESFYPGAPKLSTLAASALAAYRTLYPDVPISSVMLDSTLWNPADNWDPSVNRSEQTSGYLSETTALQVDGDRADPRAWVSPRSTDPVGRAGAAFVADLGLSITPTRGAAPAGAVQLASVASQPIRALIGQMLATSDNTLAEQVARLVSLAVGGDGSSASLATAIPRALAGYGIDTTGLLVRDGSGESGLNGIPPLYVARMMVKIMQGGQNLDILYGSMPVSGQAGSLAGRFTGANAIARGAVTAKPGWIDSAFTLAGVVRAKDGSVLSFAFYAVRPGISPAAIAALDTLTTGVYNCGNNLSDQ